LSNESEDIVQTFLPYSDFRESVGCLDNKRLGKQRVEAYQILNVLSGLSKGWKNHPAVRQWEGYEVLLVNYLTCCIDEWIARGCKNTIDPTKFIFDKPLAIPWWLGYPEYHASHRSNLLRKNPLHYGQFGWKESDDLLYVWPTKVTPIKRGE
jgi:hypothetical protein